MTALLLSLFLGAAQAAEGEYRLFSPGFAPTFSLDYIGVGTLDRHVDADGQARCKALLAAGATFCGAASAGTGALGGRAGLMYRTQDYAIGPSVGAYYGGPTSGRTTIATTPTGALETRVRDTTFRFLLEDSTRWEVGEDRAILLGAGGGVALVHEHDSCTASGALLLLCGPERAYGRGFWTWEVGPSVLVGPVELAFRYVGFAHHKLKPWNTFSFTFGFRL